MKLQSPANDDEKHLDEKHIQLQILEYIATNYPNGHPNDPARRKPSLTIVREDKP